MKLFFKIVIITCLIESYISAPQRIDNEDNLFYDVAKKQEDGRSPIEDTLKTFHILRHDSEANLQGSKDYKMFLDQLPRGISPVMKHISNLVPDHIQYDRSPIEVQPDPAKVDIKVLKDFFYNNKDVTPEPKVVKHEKDGRKKYQNYPKKEIQPRDKESETTNSSINESVVTINESAVSSNGSSDISNESDVISNVSGATSNVPGASSNVTGAPSNVSGAPSNVSGASSNVTAITPEVSDVTLDVDQAISTNDSSSNLPGDNFTSEANNNELIDNTTQGNQGVSSNATTTIKPHTSDVDMPVETTKNPELINNNNSETTDLKDETTTVSTPAYKPFGYEGTNSESANTDSSTTSTTVFQGNALGSGDVLEASSSGGGWGVFQVFLVIAFIGTVVFGFIYYRHRNRFRGDEVSLFSRRGYTDFQNPTFTGDQNEVNMGTLRSQDKGSNYKSFD